MFRSSGSSPDLSCITSILYMYLLCLWCNLLHRALLIQLMSNHCICRATMRPPHPSSTAECLRLIARLRGEQASAASWEPRSPFEAAEMD